MPITKKNNEVFRAALALPEEARAALVEALLESLEEPGQRDIDARWAREAEDRILAFDRGEIAAIPGEEVFAALRSRRPA